MKKISLIIVLLTFSLSNVFAQVATDSITIKKILGSYQFYQNQKKLKHKEVANAMIFNQEAYTQFKSAQSSYALATIIGGAGGLLVGWNIGTAIGGGNPNWVMAGVGAGLIVLSLPLNQSFNKKGKQAVEAYNSNIKASIIKEKNQLNLSISGNKVGFVFRF
jgi:hypothetical protein